jgi:hypothetical protein
MKIIKKLLPILLILGFILTPFTSAFAYTGGLLNGQILKYGTSILDTSPISSYNGTDGNVNSNISLAVSGGDDTLWYDFSSPVNINAYQLDGLNGSARIYFYDSTNTLIGTYFTATMNGTKININYQNVSKVVVANIHSSNNLIIREFDVFSDGAVSIVKTDVTNLQVSNITETSATISYDKPVGYSGVTFDYAKIYKDGLLVTNLGPAGSSYNLGGLSPNTSYTIKVSAKYSDGTETTGLTKTFTTLAPVKTDVTNVDVTGITKTEASVSWSAPTGYSGVTLSGFKIYVDGILKHTASPSSSSYSLTGLTPDTSYTVKVVASYSDGTETTGVTKVFNTLVPEDETAPVNVTNLVATPTFDSISLSWTNPPDQDFAKVKVYEDGIYKKSVTAAEGSSAFFDNLEPDTVYSFKVTSIDNIGNESSGSVIEVKTLPLPEIKKIKNLDATSKFDRVKLSWELPESEYFHHVNIYRKVVEEKSFFESLFSLGTITVSAADTEEEYKPMFETNGTYWTDLTVDPETNYEYKLTSENVDGRESEEGVIVQVSTPEEPKPVIKDAQFQQATNGDYVIGWSEPTTGNVKIKVGGNDYKTVPANLKTYTIPKSDLAYTTIGDPDVTIQPVTERGTEGDAVSSPKMNLPFSAKDLVESGNGLLWLVGPFILLALAFLLVPKFRNLILAAFRGKGNLTDTAERRSTKGDKDLKLETKGEIVRLQKEPRELRTPRMKDDKAEREVRTGREPRQSIRESRTPRVSRRGR